MKQRPFLVTMAVVVLALSLACGAPMKTSEPPPGPPGPEAAPPPAAADASPPEPQPIPAPAPAWKPEDVADRAVDIDDWHAAARDDDAAADFDPGALEPPPPELFPGEAAADGEGADFDDEPRAIPSSAEPAGPVDSRLSHSSTDTAETRSRQAVAEIPIELFRGASYAFVTPPDLRYRERVEVLFRVDPTRTALEARDEVQRAVDEAARLTPAGQLPLLRGAVEATTGPWSRCMEAELHETTVSSNLTALDLDPDKDRTHLEICELEPDDGSRHRGNDGERPCLEAPSGPRSVGLHPTEWRWRIQGARAGRAQLMLRLYAVAQQEKEDGSFECLARDLARPGSYRRIRTFQRRMTVEVSAAERIEHAAWTPWLWSLIFLPLGGLLALYRRSRARSVLS